MPAASPSLTPAGLRPAPAGTARSRAAAARSRRRSAVAGGAAKDPCPRCGSELGQSHGATRRVAVFSRERGLFLWRCPDCAHGWAEAASSQSGSTTRSPERMAAAAPRPAG